MNIHSTAVVHPDAELADDVEIRPYTVIGPKVRVGAGSIIGPHAVVDGDTVIGERNHFFSGSQVGVLSQDLKHEDGLLGRTVIGDDNLIRELVTISASTLKSAEETHETRIGNNCLLMAYSHVAHDCILGNNIIMANYTGISGHAIVEDSVTFSGFSGVHQGTRVGRNCFIGGLSKCTKDCPPYMFLEGNPLRVVAPNTIGLQRKGFDADSRKRIKNMYKIMYRSNLNTTQALEEIERSIEDCEERTVFTEFVRAAKRGIVK